jgi:hypothetical protein
MGMFSIWGLPFPYGDPRIEYILLDSSLKGRPDLTHFFMGLPYMMSATTAPALMHMFIS